MKNSVDLIVSTLLNGPRPSTIRFRTTQKQLVAMGRKDSGEIRELVRFSKKMKPQVFAKLKELAGLSKTGTGCLVFIGSVWNTLNVPGVDSADPVTFTFAPDLRGEEELIMSLPEWTENDPETKRSLW